MGKLKVAITGSTGMVGKGVLLECLDDERVGEVLVINRSSLSMEHPKLKEVLLKDFADPAPIKNELEGYDAVYFCLGVSAGGMKEVDYKHITYDYTLALANVYKEANPNGTFVYVSGTGTDSSEEGSMMWARVKGKTENDLLKMGFKQAFMFRPGVIRPLRGIASRTPLYNTAYVIIKPLWPLLTALFGNSITDTTKIGKAMINVTIKGSDKQYFENPEINKLAQQ